MDLALELGMTPAGVRRMSERDFRDLSAYANRKMLRSRRVELLLAQVSLLIATTMGGAKDAKLADYLFDPPDDSGDFAESEEDAEVTVDDIVAQFGGRVYRKKVVS